MRVELLGLEPDSLADIVGDECYELALRYVRDGAVTQQVWVAEQNALCGIVRGRHGGFYTPAVYFTSGTPATVSGTQCSCTSRWGCEHAAALLLSATRAADGRDADGRNPDSRNPDSRNPDSRDTNAGAAWER